MSATTDERPPASIPAGSPGWVVLASSRRPPTAHRPGKLTPTGHGAVVVACGKSGRLIDGAPPGFPVPPCAPCWRAGQ